MLQRFLHNKTAMITVAIVCLTALVGIFAPWIAPNDPYEPAIQAQSHHAKESLTKDATTHLAHTFTTGEGIRLQCRQLSAAYAGGFLPV